MEAAERTILGGGAWALIRLLAIWLPTWWLWNYVISAVFSLFDSTGILIYLWLASKAAASFKIENTEGG